MFRVYVFGWFGVEFGLGGVAVWDSCFEFFLLGGRGMFGLFTPGVGGVAQVFFWEGGLGSPRLQNFGCSGFMISGLRVCLGFRSIVRSRDVF